jgi:hypothetical protein
MNKDSLMEIHLEYEDLYLDLLQKAQDIIKTQTLNPEEQSNIPYEAFYQNYGYYYGMNSYVNPYMGMMGRGSYGYRGGSNYNNQYYNNYYNQMFIRKAQDEANEVEPPRGEYYSHSGKKRDKYSKKNLIIRGIKEAIQKIISNICRPRKLNEGLVSIQKISHL